MLPIIIFHLGRTKYLEMSITQAQSYSNRVILIGDSTNKGSTTAEHVDYSSHVSPEFVKLYRHVSPNNATFERVCIHRWFIIRSVMASKNISRAFICDSDVLLFCNTSDKQLASLYPNDFYISTTTTKYRVTAGQSIFSLSRLSDFTSYILKFYREAPWDTIEQNWKALTSAQKAQGGISDMYLLYSFLLSFQSRRTEAHRYYYGMLELPPLPSFLKEHDLSQPNCEQSLFDNSIDLLGDGFGTVNLESTFYDFHVSNMPHNCIKAIEWIDGKPTCILKAQSNKHNTNRHGVHRLKLLSLHFHGCKDLLPRCLHPPQRSVTAVLFSLNDCPSPSMGERFQHCLNYFTACCDEVVYIDWGSPNGVSLFTKWYSRLKNPDKIVHMQYTRAQVNDILKLNHCSSESVHTSTKQPLHFIQQSFIRNIGIRAAKSEYIISTNIDIIAPEREELQEVLRQDDGNTFYTINRKNVSMKLASSVLWNTHPSWARKQLERVVLSQRRPGDLYPEDVFREECKKKIHGQSLLRAAYIQYSKIWNCGDFQMAHRNVWYAIRGFEQAMTATSTGTDTMVQKKALEAGFRLVVLNFPHVYHMSHGRRSAHAKNCPQNDMTYWLLEASGSQNSENWGITFDF